MTRWDLTTEHAELTEVQWDVFGLNSLSALLA